MSDDDTPTPLAELGLSQELLDGLIKREIITATPIQAAAIPHCLKGGDIQAQARTGSGKTLAFLLPIAQRIAASTCTRAWVVCPTRELAQQASREAEILVGKRKVATLVGGVPVGSQLRELRNEPSIICGTPGRMVDLLGQGRLQPDAEVMVLDEADQMLDMGFRDDLDALVQDLGPGVERWCFSATYPPAVQRAVARWMVDPQVLRLDTRSGSAHVPQHFCVTQRGGETTALARLLQALRPERAIVFVRTRDGVDQLVTRLATDGIEAAGISGDLSQEARERVLARFRAGSISVLSATDVAARGLDVQGVSHVFNLGLPMSSEAYTHRIGRTARAGADGAAWSVINTQDRGRFLRMTERAGCRPDYAELPTAKDIAELRRETLANQVQEGIGEKLKLPKCFAEICKEHGAEAVLASLVHRLVPEPVPEKPRPERPARGDKDPCTAGVVIDRGAADGLTPAVVVAMVCRCTGLEGREFGRMRIFGGKTILACTPQAAARLLNEDVHYHGELIQVRADSRPPNSREGGGGGGGYDRDRRGPPRGDYQGGPPRRGKGPPHGNKGDRGGYRGPPRDRD
ncbi:MAG: DEAD/DEAH box helicase [Planctomycetota bacterium]|jgi:ATP-dependent RNA helicase DeaD|nr:DEAD/DEAH box helicase [Planctomycetota bacterium]